MNENVFQLRYLVMPDYIYTDDRLTLISSKVYCFIHSYTNPFYFSNEHLAKMFKCSERSISEAMGTLEELGYINMTHTPKAGGGTTRLAVDCVSDSQSSSSPIYSIKDNNIKNMDNPIVNTLEEAEEQLGESDSLRERREAKEALRNKKTLFVQGSFRPRDNYGSAGAGKVREYEKKRGGVFYYGK